jgi:alpha-beta hydrolase superfamily lysophospholipase
MSSNSAGSNRTFKISTIRDRSNSLDLRFGIQPPVSGNCERWLVFSNGRTEWLDKYCDLAQDIGVAPTTSYLGFDHRGQGGSGGARAWIDSYTCFAKDMADVIQQATQGKPYNLVCHSMGCIIGLTAIMEGLIRPRCVVLSGPMLGLPRHLMPPHIAFKISRFVSSLGLGHINTGAGRHSVIPFEENVLTHSAERYQIIQSTPFPVPSPTFGWVQASYEATQNVLKPERLKKLTMPVLVMCGTDDSVIDINAIQPWVLAAQTHAPGSIDLQWIQGGRHELLFESHEYYDKALEIMRQWFTKVGCSI